MGARREIQVRFVGRVQGVGFRYTAVEAAQRRGVKGFVRNESDGSVYLVGQGPEPALRELLADLHDSHLGRFIIKTDVLWTEPAGAMRGFEIQR